jgi:hypothetical protein
MRRAAKRKASAITNSVRLIARRFVLVRVRNQFDLLVFLSARIGAVLFVCFISYLRARHLQSDEERENFGQLRAVVANARRSEADEAHPQGTGVFHMRQLSERFL